MANESGGRWVDWDELRASFAALHRTLYAQAHEPDGVPLRLTPGVYDIESVPPPVCVIGPEPPYDGSMARRRYWKKIRER